MDKKEIWPVALDALMAMGKEYVPAMEKSAQKAGVDRETWVLLLAALCFDPDPVSNARLQKRTPYQSFNRRLDDAVEMGLLDPAGGESYRLTAPGREVAQAVVQAAYACMEELDPMRASDLHYLVILLRKLVRASQDAPEPPGKWCLTLSRRLDPGENAHLVIQADQKLSDLAAYRDDSHLAAWRPLGFNGPTWEAFTLIWRGTANTLDKIHHHLAHRNHDRQVYEASLDDLANRSLVTVASDQITVTPGGNQLRQEVEDQTDQYFYAPWDCLIEEDLEALHNLLTLLGEGFGP